MLTKYSKCAIISNIQPERGQMEKRGKCPKCGNEKFFVLTDHEIEDIHNLMADYYTITLKCSNKNCNYEHEIDLGSD